MFDREPPDELTIDHDRKAARAVVADFGAPRLPPSAL
jgi:hypothetical protein